MGCVRYWGCPALFEVRLLETIPTPLPLSPVRPRMGILAAAGRGDATVEVMSGGEAVTMSALRKRSLAPCGRQLEQGGAKTQSTRLAR